MRVICKKEIAFIWIIALFLSSCHPLTSGTQHTKTLPTSGSTTPRILIDNNPPKISSETQTIIVLEPSITPSPTKNLELIDTFVPFYRHFSTEVEAGRENFRNDETAIAKFPGKCKEGDINTGISPDRKWLECLNPNVVPNMLYFVNESNKEIFFQIPGGNRAEEWIYANTVRWSRDGNYVWIKLILEAGEMLPCYLKIPSQGMYRVEFPTGFISQTLPIDKNGYSSLFSPSGRYLAHVSGEHDLTVLDLQTGASSGLSDSQFITGSMAFSPDEQSLAFSTQNQNPNMVDCNNSKLMTFSFDSRKIETVFTDQRSAPIQIFFWDNTDTIGFRFSRENYASINMQNRKVTIIE